HAARAPRGRLDDARTACRASVASSRAAHRLAAGVRTGRGDRAAWVAGDMGGRRHGWPAAWVRGRMGCGRMGGEAAGNGTARVAGPLGCGAAWAAGPHGLRG